MCAFRSFFFFFQFLPILRVHDCNNIHYNAGKKGTEAKSRKRFPKKIAIVLALFDKILKKIDIFRLHTQFYIDINNPTVLFFTNCPLWINHQSNFFQKSFLLGFFLFRKFYSWDLAISRKRLIKSEILKVENILPAMHSGKYYGSLFPLIRVC